MPESLSTDPQVLQQLDKLAFINSIQFGRKVQKLEGLPFGNRHAFDQCLSPV